MKGVYSQQRPFGSEASWPHADANLIKPSGQVEVESASDLALKVHRICMYWVHYPDRREAVGLSRRLRPDRLHTMQ